MNKKLLLLMSIGIILGCLMSCSRLTMDNYNKIKSGMTYEETTRILGTPDKCNDLIGMRNCVWGNEKKSVTVAFVGDKVLLFSANNIR
ncbi:MAG TPA: hypothetical protein VK452_01545 [Dissulfurispiraceae bacterium]|nr:hypothetical protein [Dissulfurispiraceae bacterium]